MAESHEYSSGEAAKQILAYYLRNPEAADSAEGIARWRLLESIVRRSLNETEGALRWLVEEGYLKEEEVPGARNVFLLNREKMAQAARLIENDPPDR